jgi:uroporphyrinogen-III synthase
MIPNNLKPYTLILREAERAAQLKDLLIKNNINVLIEPIYKISPIKFKPIAIQEYKALLLTSVNTVKILTNQIKTLKKIETYCVGKVTEKYALEAGFNCIKTKAKSGKTLASEVIKHNKNDNNKILIVGGNNLAYDPIPDFKNANIKAERIIVYKKIPNKKMSHDCLELLKNKKISNVVLYSPETAKIFINLVKNYDIKNIHVTCLGLKAKTILEVYNWKKIQVIDNIELKSFANSIIKSNLI